MNTLKDRERLDTILEMIDHLERRLATFTYENFADDGDERDLTAYRLSVIGENASKLSEIIKVRNSGLPWRSMSALRNVVSHEYRAVVPRFLWNAVQDLESIKKMCLLEAAH